MCHKKFSVIIPVYNRPDELAELLESLTQQTRPADEIIIVEDGSKTPAEGVVKRFQARLPLRYYVKENGGQGFARNHGFANATGDYFIIFDSDALVPPHYVETVERAISLRSLDAYGGPDAAHPSFTPVQRAISYSMTSPFTTGGIRGKANNLGGQFHPRSFNMGLSRKVYETVGGYKITRMGEDIEFAIRIIEAGFTVGLIPDAFIYHKRRTSLAAFFRQLRFFGRARINIARFYPKELKLVHWFPAVFTLALASVPIWALVFPPFFWLGLAGFSLFAGLIFADALRKERSAKVGVLAVAAAFVQLTAYGTGFLAEGWQRLREPRHHRQTGANVEYPD